jgi:hypothetical protein
MNEGFNYKDYRDSLAKKLREEQNHNKRKKILKKEESQNYYKTSKGIQGSLRIIDQSGKKQQELIEDREKAIKELKDSGGEYDELLGCFTGRRSYDEVETDDEAQVRTQRQLKIIDIIKALNKEIRDEKRWFGANEKSLKFKIDQIDLYDKAISNMSNLSTFRSLKNPVYGLERFTVTKIEGTAPNNQSLITYNFEFFKKENQISMKFSLEPDGIYRYRVPKWGETFIEQEYGTTVDLLAWAMEIASKKMLKKKDSVTNQTMESLGDKLRQVAGIRWEERLKDTAIQPLTESEKRFSDLFGSVEKKEFKEVLNVYYAKLVPLVRSEGDVEILRRAIKGIQKLDRETEVTEENIGRYLHEPLSGTREEINAARFRELLEAILLTNHPDIRDFNFITQIVKKTSNKYLRNLAIKKSVDVFNSVKGSDLSLSELHSRNNKISARSFLFTSPIAFSGTSFSDGVMRTIEAYSKGDFGRAGSSRESTLFSSMVDLFDGNGDRLRMLVEMLDREQQSALLSHSEKIRNRYFSKSSDELKGSYSLAVHELLRDKRPEEYRDIVQFSPEEQGDFIDDIFEDVWANMSDDEKHLFWNKIDLQLSAVFEDLASKELTRNSRFEEILKKLSAIKLQDKSLFEQILSGKYEDLQDLNNEIDNAQLVLFERVFELSDADLQELIDIPGFVHPQTKLADERSGLSNLYKTKGNFNAALILMERYRAGAYSKLKPPVFRENLTLLLKEAMYHAAHGDFDSWRSSLDTSIQGNDFRYREGDRPFWDTWNKDGDSSYFSGAHSVNLAEGMRKEFGRSHKSFFEDTHKYLLNPELWKDEVAKEVLKNHKDIQATVSKLNELRVAISSLDDKVLLEHGLSSRDQASLGRAKKIIKCIESVINLCDLFLGGNDQLINSNFLKIDELLKDVNIGMLLPESKNNSGEKLPGYIFLNALTQSRVKIKESIEKRKAGKLSVMDSSEPFDLLMVGQQSHLLINCMSYEGDPNKNAHVLDILTSKNKKVLVVKIDGRPVARAVLKILRNSLEEDSGSIILIDDVLLEPGYESYNFSNEIVEHLKKKFSDIPDVVIAKAVRDDKENNLKKLNELNMQITRGEIDYGQLPQKTKDDLDLFRQKILLAWATGSRVSSELVETGHSVSTDFIETGSNGQPEMRYEPKVRQAKNSHLPTAAFYSQFVIKK